MLKIGEIHASIHAPRETEPCSGTKWWLQWYKMVIFPFILRQF